MHRSGRSGDQKYETVNVIFYPVDTIYLILYEDGDFAIVLKGGSVNVLPRRFFLSDPLIENNSAIESREV